MPGGRRGTFHAFPPLCSACDGTATSWSNAFDRRRFGLRSGTLYLRSCTRDGHGIDGRRRARAVGHVDDQPRHVVDVRAGADSHGLDARFPRSIASFTSCIAKPRRVVVWSEDETLQRSSVGRPHDPFFGVVESSSDRLTDGEVVADRVDAAVRRYFDPDAAPLSLTAETQGRCSGLAYVANADVGLPAGIGNGVGHRARRRLSVWPFTVAPHTASPSIFRHDVDQPSSRRAYASTASSPA